MNRHVALPWVLVAGLSVMWLMQSLNPVPCTPDVIANIKVPAPTPRSRAPTPIATTEPPMPELPEPAPFTLPKRRWVGRECLEGGAIRPDQQPTKWCSDFSSKVYENDPAPAARCESTDPWLEGIGARNQSTFCVMKRGEFDTAITSEALWKLYKTLEYKFRRCRTEDALRHAQLKLDGFSMYLNMSEACGGWNVTFTAEEYLAILHVHSDNGTRPIVFSGDSVTRQTFTRIIFHIRGLSRAIEWSSWGDTSYNVYAKEDHVMINTLESIPEQTHQKRHRVVGALVQLLFLWEPKATPEFQHWIEAWHPLGVTTVNQSSCDVLNFRIHTGDLAVLHTSALPAIHVHSRNYWIENVNNSISSLKKFTYDISQIARATKKRKGCPTLPYHYFQFATPFTEGPQGEGWEWKIPLQNRAGAEMVEEAQSEIQEPWKRGSIVRHKPSMAFFDVNAGPMSGLSEADLKRLRSRDGTHFQCAYLKAFPQPIELMYPNELDCIDPAELGFWHWMAVVFVTMRA